MTARPRLPDVLLAGVPKAGTSTLAQWLGAHPDVYLPPDKEVHFFDRPRRVRTGLDWYRHQFAGPGRVALDATPTYALRDAWLQAAVETVPGAKLVVLMRHPVDRMWSTYWYLRSMGLELRSLAQVVDDGLAGGERPPSRLHDGDYRAVLERLDRFAGDSPTLLLLHDDLAAEPDSVWAQTCSFLGIAAVARPVHVGERLNVTGTLRSFRLRYWSMRLDLFRWVPRLALAADRWNRTDRRPPPMPPDVRQRLLEHYEPSVAAVERRLGRSLPAWRA